MGVWTVITEDLHVASHWNSSIRKHGKFSLSLGSIRMTSVNTVGYSDILFRDTDSFANALTF